VKEKNESNERVRNEDMKGYFPIEFQWAFVLTTVMTFLVLSSSVWNRVGGITSKQTTAHRLINTGLGGTNDSSLLCRVGATRVHTALTTVRLTTQCFV
jgi:hypothetical protein